MDDPIDVGQGQLFEVATADMATALVIDDEGMIRHLLHRILEPSICHVAEAASGEEGLRIIECGAPSIDIVLTDLKMPGLDGWDVIEVLAKYRPDLPVAAISGYGGTVEARAQSLGARLLPKPFTEAELSALVATLIADARVMRARAQAQRTRAAHARQSNLSVRQLHAELRVRLDLVAAAWDLRRRLNLGGE